jgi:hypothetical protein
MISPYVHYFTTAVKSKHSHGTGTCFGVVINQGIKNPPSFNLKRSTLGKNKMNRKLLFFNLPLTERLEVHKSLLGKIWRSIHFSK